MRAADALAAMRALPVADLDAIDGGETALLLAPHADDESLGCGGFIAEACARGQPPHVLVLTDGAGSHQNSRLFPPARLRALRQQEARDAVAILGLPPHRIGFLDLPDTAAPTSGAVFDNAVRTIAAQCDGCGLLLAPWRWDPHCDHEAAHLMAAAAACLAGVRHLAYPVWGWTLPDDADLPGPAPAGWRLRMDRHLPAKRRAIAAHASQYSDLISDDPAGFRLPAGLLAMFDRPYETFLRVDHAEAAVNFSRAPAPC